MSLVLYSHACTERKHIRETPRSISATACWERRIAFQMLNSRSIASALAERLIDLDYFRSIIR